MVHFSTKDQTTLRILTPLGRKDWESEGRISQSNPTLGAAPLSAIHTVRKLVFAWIQSVSGSHSPRLFCLLTPVSLSPLCSPTFPSIHQLSRDPLPWKTVLSQFGQRDWIQNRNATNVSGDLDLNFDFGPDMTHHVRMRRRC